MKKIKGSNAEIEVENFDDLFVGSPEEIERNLRSFLPRAEALEDKSIFLQILSQIALAQAMQKKFEEAHKTLDKAESGLNDNYTLAKTRILLERGRVYHQSDNNDQAINFFKRSYEISVENKYDFHMVNAAHMIAIVEENVDAKIGWNKKAINLAENSEHDSKAYGWLGTLYNNLAQNFLEAKQYQNALEAFEMCKKHGEKNNHDLVIKGARWGIARALRSLGRIEEALSIQLSLKNEYEQIAEQETLPIDIIRKVRGVVYEELCEIYAIYMKQNAGLAFEDLSNDYWYKKLEPQRIKRMHDLKNFL